MANVRTERGRYRPFVIVALPILLLAWSISAAVTLAVTQQAAAAVPLGLVALALVRMMRWPMVWLSTPAERKVLAPTMKHEPVTSLFRDLMKARRKPDAAASGSDSADSAAAALTASRPASSGKRGNRGKRA